MYTYIRHNAETTTDDVVDSLEIPQRTAYDYINDLESAGFIEQSNEGRPARYTAHEIDLQLVQDDVQRQITPALIEAIARREKDEDIDTYIERHGVNSLGRGGPRLL
ncbi:helix-turn-helix domain-containing protein [Natronorubrum sp. A-ect3]|uniref:helix-turn-helix domain-containing protein n=1 Tax=Natronorubrum sp. A-ect3 TaxID=3242698 RepID=UPI00359D923A